MRIREGIEVLRALLFAILWTSLIAPLTILLACVVGLLAGGPGASPPSRNRVRRERRIWHCNRRFRHYRRF